MYQLRDVIIASGTCSCVDTTLSGTCSPVLISQDTFAELEWVHSTFQKLPHNFVSPANTADAFIEEL